MELELNIIAASVLVSVGIWLLQPLFKNVDVSKLWPVLGIFWMTILTLVTTASFFGRSELLYFCLWLTPALPLAILFIQGKEKKGIPEPKAEEVAQKIPTQERLRDILDNLKEGVIVLGEDLTIDVEYSGDLIPIIGIDLSLVSKERLKGIDGLDLLFHSSSLSPLTVKQIRKILSLTVGSTPLTLELNQHFLPSLLKKNTPNSERILSCEFKPLIESTSGLVSGILISLQDRTEILHKMQQVQYHQEELVIFRESLDLSKYQFREYFESSNRMLDQTRSLIHSNSKKNPELAANLANHLKMVKGYSQSLGLTFAADLISRAQSNVDRVLLQPNEEIDQDFLLGEINWISANLKRYERSVENRPELPRQERMLHLYDKFIDEFRYLSEHSNFDPAFEKSKTYQKLKGTFLEIDATSIADLIGDFPEEARKVAAYLQIADAKVRINGGEIKISYEYLSSVKTVLLKCLWHSVLYGMENPKDRQLAGKSEQGTIDVAACVTGDTLDVVIRHDGLGISLKDLGLDQQIHSLIPNEQILTQLTPRHARGFEKVKGADVWQISGLDALVTGCGGRVQLNFPKGAEPGMPLSYEWYLTFPLIALRRHIDNDAA